jgi:hypothetical protein
MKTLPVKVSVSRTMKTLRGIVPVTGTMIVVPMRFSRMVIKMFFVASVVRLMLVQIFMVMAFTAIVIPFSPIAVCP